MGLSTVEISNILTLPGFIIDRVIQMNKKAAIPQAVEKKVTEGII